MIIFIFFLIFSLQISCSLRSVLVRKCKNRIGTEIHSNLSSREDYPAAQIEFEAYCPEACSKLRQEIITLAKGQLGLGGSLSLFDFDNYEIENWPEFVPFSIRLWDRQAYQDLKSALPNLIFKPKQLIVTRRSRNTKIFISNRMINRSKLAAKLLDLFNEQTNSRSKCIKWQLYNIINWPVGVSLHMNHFSAIEVLTVFRHLDRIRFVKVAEGETRTVTYADGTVLNAENLENWRLKYNRNRNIKRKRDESETETDESESKGSVAEKSESKDSEADELDGNISLQIPTNMIKYNFDIQDFDEIISSFDDLVEENDGTMINLESLKHYNPDLDSF